MRHRHAALKSSLQIGHLEKRYFNHTSLSHKFGTPNTANLSAFQVTLRTWCSDLKSLPAQRGYRFRMASKSSRWAVDEHSGADAQLKGEKEAKKRLRKQKQLARSKELAATATAHAKEVENDLAPANIEYDQPPTKRRRTSAASHAVEDIPRPAEGSHLLPLPKATFGPASSVEQYQILNPIEEGTYGWVSRARHKATATVVALKKLKMDNQGDGFPITALREIQCLSASSHPHIVALREVIIGSSLSE